VLCAGLPSERDEVVSELPALLAAVRLPAGEAHSAAPATQAAVDMELRSFEECVAFIR
jgi:hypothetical protein